VTYFKAVQDHAAGVLAEAEENPARFRRDAAARRENASLRSDIADLKAAVLGRGKDDGDGTPAADAETKAERDEYLAQEGARRREMVVENGFKVDAVAKAYADANEPDDFDRWFAKWALKNARDTSQAATDTTNKNRKRGGSTLRRRGPSTPKPAEVGADDDVMTASGIDSFLRKHPSNKGRYP
jgi:hypothetical protein